MSIKEGIARFFGWADGPYRAIAIAIVVLLVVLFGRDIKDMVGVRAEIIELTERKEELRRQIAADSTLLENLKDPDFLEKFARENYLMRREGEEVYIIEK
ncbi:MAG: septum formation initiator family protein [Rikenellaceae bacterium]|jgi:cell division protein FtsB|nr:septum formation initiator family protein [Rikenellaceae bacterium]